jgi:hypothetical protein
MWHHRAPSGRLADPSALRPGPSAAGASGLVGWPATLWPRAAGAALEFPAGGRLAQCGPALAPRAPGGRRSGSGGGGGVGFGIGRSGPPRAHQVAQ